MVAHRHLSATDAHLHLLTEKPSGCVIDMIIAQRKRKRAREKERMCVGVCVRKRVGKRARERANVIVKTKTNQRVSEREKHLSILGARWRDGRTIGLRKV